MVFIVKVGSEQLRYNAWYDVQQGLQPLFEHGLKKAEIVQEV